MFNKQVKSSVMHNLTDGVEVAFGQTSDDKPLSVEYSQVTESFYCYRGQKCVKSTQSGIEAKRWINKSATIIIEDHI